MNLFTRNSPYYHLLKYLLFFLKHPVYYCWCVCMCSAVSTAWYWNLDTRRMRQSIITAKEIKFCRKPRIYAQFEPEIKIFFTRLVHRNFSLTTLRSDPRKRRLNNQPDADKLRFIDVISSTYFGHHYAHHQEYRREPTDRLWCTTLVVLC
jgi:hypothetical protein